MIVSFQENDMTELYKVVDTALFNEMYGADEFIRRANFIKESFKECGSVLFDSIKAVTISSSRTTEYTIPLCVEKEPHQLNNNLVISFDDDRDMHKVLFFEIRNTLFINDSALLKQFNPKPPVPPGK